ncbi:MAG: methyltransferase domain-containing protein [Limnospira sp. PMC 1234.20]|uniref:methyltransferase domain-containing protein n=1 Tax=Limnospira sp. PMC 1234.20 TaxID=2981032 RepID=UPI0028E143DE|nr:methyltransferase domain-containing protein [Limnospira sp. PMC 1234.20]MDT9268888.1 methyltransferase domain-containing protein [Limnospira sp. PMC 1234.20]
MQQSPQPSALPVKPNQPKPNQTNSPPKNPREHHRFLYYKSVLTNLIDVKTTTGLEIGAFDRPFFTPGQGDISYADYRTTQELKKLARDTPGHSANFVVDVTYNLSQINLSDIPKKHDYIIGSHVLEHTPNMIGFLNQISDLLNNTGFAFFVIPDKRYTFDVLKPLTSLGEILENNFNNLERPSFRHVFNSNYYNRPLNLGDVWSGKTNSQSLSRIPRDVKQLISTAAKSKESYIDTHCNIFTDVHFYDVISELIKYNLVNFAKAEVYQTKQGYLDFLCILWKAESRTSEIYSLFPDLKSRLINSNLPSSTATSATIPQTVDVSNLPKLESLRSSLTDYQHKLKKIVDDFK